MDSTIEPNVSDQTATNQTTVIERMEKNKYKIPILSDREADLTKKPEDVVGANLRVSVSHIRKI